MIIKEAELQYGKAIAKDIWSRLDLSIVPVSDTPEGLDIPDHIWEAEYRRIQNE